MYSGLFPQGYKLRNAYIAAQAPLQETVSDFWRMIWEFKSKAIVMLCNFEESGQVSSYYCASYYILIFIIRLTHANVW